MKFISNFLQKACINVNFLVLTASLVLILSVVISLSYNDRTWFQRFGAVVQIIGILLSIRPIIRMGFGAWKESLDIIDCGTLCDERTVDKIQEDDDRKAVIWGIFLAVIGTLVSSFGDLIGRLIHFSIQCKIF